MCIITSHGVLTRSKNFYFNMSNIEIVFNVLCISFGPAHPAAHGVFRLILLSKAEIIFSASGIQGLLFRATESLIPSRIALCIGYFARLDYVSYFVLENGVGYNFVNANCSLLNFFTSINTICNSLLNVSCTYADAGLVSAIL